MERPQARYPWTSTAAWLSGGLRSVAQKPSRRIGDRPISALQGRALARPVGRCRLRCLCRTSSGRGRRSHRRGYPEVSRCPKWISVTARVHGEAIQTRAQRSSPTPLRSRAPATIYFGKWISLFTRAAAASLAFAWKWISPAPVDITVHCAPAIVAGDCWITVHGSPHGYHLQSAPIDPALYTDFYHT